MDQIRKGLVLSYLKPNLFRYLEILLLLNVERAPIPKEKRHLMEQSLTADNECNKFSRIYYLY